VEGGFNVWFREISTTEDKTQINGYIMIADKMEATMFAVSHMAQWQKWSRDQEAEEAKDRRRAPSKLTVTKDGRVKIRATVETISDL
jgi:hypothetical protein